MIRTDGLSQEDRREIISKLRYPLVLDNRVQALWERSVSIASYLRFFSVNQQGALHPPGYFASILNHLMKHYDPARMQVDGKMDPSLAVLYNFLENLYHTTEVFNTRWKDFPDWYWRKVIGAKPRTLQGDKVWVSFEPSGGESLTIPGKTGFKVDYQDGSTSYYDLADDVEVHDISISGLYLLEFQKQRKDLSGAGTSLRSIRLRELQMQDADIYAEKQIHTAVGIRITSPVLVLHEGVRKVTINCFLLARDTLNDVKAESFHSIFKISISTEKGWEPIEEYIVRKSDERLIIEFTLPDYFPATAGCNVETHRYVSAFPTVNLHLNLDSSDYQYSRIGDFQISKVRVAVSVQKVTNVKVYNELGKVDNAKPFAPFGIYTEKGAWFTIGNYEMNIKDTQHVSANFYWEQLPKHPMGLAGHYAEYGQKIHNGSFLLEVRYLSDYQWRKVSGKSRFSLFDTDSDSLQLSEMTVIGPVDVEKMPQIREDESAYDYSLDSRNGFLNFRLVSPDMGFGEELYRRIFTEQMMKNARKKLKYPTIQPPLQPILKRITIDYDAEDIIDQRTPPEVSGSRIQPIMPLEEFAVTVPVRHEFLHFVPNIEDYNLLMALDNIRGDMIITLFIDVHPVEGNDLYRDSIREQRELLRDIRVYIGHPAHWKKMPLSFVIKDETMALLMSGYMKFQFPAIIPPELYDDRGSLWIRIGCYETDTIAFPTITGIYVNAGLLEMRMPENPDIVPLLNSVEGEITEETLVPGLGHIRRITGFYGGVPQETPDDLFLRMAEHTSHKGKAVTARDYERLVLQAFPEIAKVKCIMARDNKLLSDTTVKLIVLPHSSGDPEVQRPLTPPHLLYFIEKYVRGLTSAYVRRIQVINPVYEQIVIRCKCHFKSYFSLKKKKLLEQKINQYIAPWMYSDRLPEIGYVVDLKKMHDAVVNEFRGDISFSDFSAIYISKTGLDHYIHEFFYKKAENIMNDYRVSPRAPNSIFIPADEHIILSGEGHAEWFGIDEMAIGNSFIIPKN